MGSHPRHFAGGGFDVEEFDGFEVEHGGDDVAGKAFAFVSIVAHIAVVEAARGLDAVLGVHQLVL